MNVSRGAVHVRPYPIEVPAATRFRKETRVRRLIAGFSGIVAGVSASGRKP